MNLDFTKVPNHVGIIGSRSFSRDKMTNDKMYEIIRRFVYKLSPLCIVISGGAVGIDSYAEEAAKLRGMRTTVFTPNMDLPSPQRYFKRNDQIVADLYKYQGILVAFLDESDCNGSTYTLRKAERMDVPIVKYWYQRHPLKLLDKFVAIEYNREVD